MIKYSIIIPVYNAEKYLEKLLYKFSKINRTDIEIIFVNDGSTDSSYEILKKFKFKNKKIINQSNQGVSYSRNVGIDYAQGEYILFVDCDDYLDIKVFQEIDRITKTEKYLVIKFGIYFYNRRSLIPFYIENEDCILRKKEILLKLYSTNKYNSVCNQFINRKLIKNNNIKFSLNVKNAEDFEFNKSLYRLCKEIYVLHDCYYYYYINENGTTRTLDKENVIKCFDDIMNIYGRVITDLEEFDDDEKIMIFNRIFREFETGIKRVFLIKDITKREIKNILQKMYCNVNYKTLEMQIKNYKCKTSFLQSLILSHKIIYIVKPILLFVLIKTRKIK